MTEQEVNDENRERLIERLADLILEHECDVHGGSGHAERRALAEKCIDEVLGAEY